VSDTAAAAAIARSYVESFGAGDPEAIAAHVAPDFVNEHANALGSGCNGREEYRTRLPRFLASMPGLRYDVVSVIAGHDGARGDAGVGVAVEYRLIATSDGHPLDIPGVMVITVRDGLITRRTDYWDALTFQRQVAAAPG
jgi:steroid delta-isomerase-like uncharacterized protein